MKASRTNEPTLMFLSTSMREKHVLEVESHPTRPKPRTSGPFRTRSISSPTAHPVKRLILLKNSTPVLDGRYHCCSTVFNQRPADPIVLHEIDLSWHDAPRKLPNTLAHIPVFGAGCVRKNGRPEREAMTRLRYPQTFSFCKGRNCAYGSEHPPSPPSEYERKEKVVEAGRIFGERASEGIDGHNRDAGKNELWPKTARREASQK